MPLHQFFAGSTSTSKAGVDRGARPGTGSNHKLLTIGHEGVAEAVGDLIFQILGSRMRR